MAEASWSRAEGGEAQEVEELRRLLWASPEDPRLNVALGVVSSDSDFQVC
jgi:hypothetical protein